MILPLIILPLNPEPLNLEPRTRERLHILLALRAKILEARHLTETQNKIRKRVLLAMKWRFVSLVEFSHPMKESRDLTDHAAEPHPKQATGLSSIKAIYLR